MNDRPQNPAAWLPFSIVEASRGGARDADVDVVQAWSYLLDRLAAAAALVVKSPFAGNRVDLASGMRHLLVLAAVGIDEALRFDPNPILAVTRTSTDEI